MNKKPNTYNGYETPAYTVVSAEGKIEVRRYAGSLVAQVDVSGTREESIQEGFRILAGYIFGKNSTKASVAMTTPVTQSSAAIAMTTPVTQSQQGDSWRVRFTMPRQYTRATLPQPLDARIQFVDIAPYRAVAIRFSGFAGKGSLTKHQAQLDEYVKNHNLAVTGPAQLAYYDAPFTLPWLRRNEIAYPLKD